MSSLPAQSVFNQIDAAPFASAQDVARAELAAGLALPQARIAPKYFYDPLGSKLFEAICQLDEYYLTRAEAAILAGQGQAIARVAGTGAVLIDLGAGNCAKAARLFPVLQPSQYVPVDISAAFLSEAVQRLRAEFPALPMQPIGLDFSETLVLPREVARGRRLFFYPGSSIGNFTPLQAAQCLGRIRTACGPDGGVLIGVDLVKDPAVLEAAYDDAIGVTAAFNLNALRHVNRLLGSDFDIRCWRHQAVFNAAHSRIEMYLCCDRATTVTWPGGTRGFAAGERIHTENSYKYTERGFVELLQQSGFGDVTCFTGGQAGGADFLVCHARAV